jgi:hypothetical protein
VPADDAREASIEADAQSSGPFADTGDSGEVNPYAPPSTDQIGAAPLSVFEVQSRVRPPAVAMMVGAVIEFGLV